VAKVAESGSSSTGGVEAADDDMEAFIEGDEDKEEEEEEEVRPLLFLWRVPFYGYLGVRPGSVLLVFDVWVSCLLVL
jgi:hypothetical protein